LVEKKTGRNGNVVAQLKTAPFEIQIGKLLRHTVGRELRYSAIGGIRRPAGGTSRTRIRSATQKPADEIPF
jgi:hypothetical protein